VSCPFSFLWGHHDHCSSLLAASHGCQGRCLAATVTYQQGVEVVEEAVAPVQVCAWFPSGESMEAYCNHHIAGSMEAQTSIVGGGVVTRGCLKEREGQAPSLEPTSMVPCISSAVGVHAGERAQEFDQS
jgi:hypothetical protein